MKLIDRKPNCAILLTPPRSEAEWQAVAAEYYDNSKMFIKKFVDLYLQESTNFFTYSNC